MDTCHYCCDIIEKLDKEYYDLQKEMDKQHSVYKKLTYLYCLSDINMFAKELLSDNKYYRDNQIHTLEEQQTDIHRKGLKDSELNNVNLLKLVLSIQKSDEYVITVTKKGREITFL